MTRWGESDLTGQLLRQAIEDEDGEQWELIELPAILPSGESLFPGFWPIEELRPTRATLPTARWMANYQQSPTSDEGASSSASGGAITRTTRARRRST